MGPIRRSHWQKHEKKRDEAREQLVDGIDPSGQKKLDQIDAETKARMTFKEVADEYYENLVDRDLAPATLRKKRWHIDDLAKPLHNRPIDQITAAELPHLLKPIERSGRRETAKKLRGTVSAIFRLAMVTMRAPADPSAALKDAFWPPKVKGRAAITDEKQFGELLRLDDYTGWPVIPTAMKFQIQTCTRPGGNPWGEETETRSRRPHMDDPSRTDEDAAGAQGTALSPSVRHRLGQLVGHRRSRTDIPVPVSTRKWLSENAFNTVLRRMGYSGAQVIAHGFRVTASTILNSRLFNPDVIEAALAHQDTNAIRRTYNRTTYWDQRVELIHEWADLVDEYREYNEL